MSDTIAAIANAMHADAEALRAISQNVANAQTPGFRRQIPLARASFETLALGAVADAPTALPNAAGPLDLAAAIDVRPGTLQSTGETLHLALEGSGFFMVSGSQGEMLTRRGDFRMDANGTLVTANGETVLGTNGPIQLGAGTPSISTDGTVRIGGVVVDRLRIVDLADTTALAAAGHGLYALATGEQPIESGGASQVRQGFLETANVQSVTEMIALMETMRRFEAAQRFVHAYDGMVDKAIETLGKV
jgi:flagellar basal-body rod protein FlgF